MTESGRFVLFLETAITLLLPPVMIALPSGCVFAIQPIVAIRSKECHIALHVQLPQNLDYSGPSTPISTLII